MKPKTLRERINLKKPTSSAPSEHLLERMKRNQEYKKKAEKIYSKREASDNPPNYEIIKDYLKGMTLSELEEKYKRRSDKISEMIQDHYEDLMNTISYHSLPATRKSDGYNPVLAKLKKIEVLNEEFFAKLSEPYDETLSEDEALFAWVYVHKGDSFEAIEMAGLAEGLLGDRSTYRRGVMARGQFLKEKPNVAMYIKELREKKYYSQDITKGYIQELILEQIHQVKDRADKREAVHLRQLIELLGKSIGAFTEKIEIHEVDPSKSLDLLIEMAKEAEVKELT